MTDEAAGCSTSSEFPEAEGLVPGSGESIGAVGRDDLQIISKVRNHCR